MTTFDDRERAFENLYAHDQDLLFRAQVRRDRAMGHWAAKQLGLAEAEAEAYADALVSTSVERGADGVAARVAEDLARHGQHVTDHQIRRRMDELMAEAVDHAKRG